MSKEEQIFYFDETLIDILWEVKEGKKHPNRAFKEINKYADQEVKKAVLKALEKEVPKAYVNMGLHASADHRFYMKKASEYYENEVKKRYE